MPDTRKNLAKEAKNSHPGQGVSREPHAGDGAQPPPSPFPSLRLTLPVHRPGGSSDAGQRPPGHSPCLNTVRGSPVDRVSLAQVVILPRRQLPWEHAVIPDTHSTHTFLAQSVPGCSRGTRHSCGRPAGALEAYCGRTKLPTGSVREGPIHAQSRRASKGARRRPHGIIARIGQKPGPDRSLRPRIRIAGLWEWGAL